MAYARDEIIVLSDDNNGDAIISRVETCISYTW